MREKKALRERILAQRDALDPAARSRTSRSIVSRLLDLPEYQAASSVAAYASFGSELETAEFLEGVLRDGKRLLLPRINKAERRLELRQVETLDQDLVAGVWGIREPAERCPLIPATQAGLVLVPGVAFTIDGDRLGYGGGFYDRLMLELDPRTARIAAAFSLQVIERVPMGERDQRVHKVISEPVR